MAYITKRGDSWFAQIRRKGHKSLSKSFPTKTLAQQWARKQEQLIDAQKYQDTRIIADLRFGDLVDKYINEVGEKKSFRRTKLHALNSLKKKLGHEMCVDLTKERLIQFAKERQNEGAGGVTIGIDLSYIGTVFKAARALWNLPLSTDALNDVRTVFKFTGVSTRSKERDRRPTEDELNRLYAHFDEKYAQIKGSRKKVPMTDIIKFAIDTTMRAGEIINLRWEDLNEENRTITIRDRKHPEEKEGNDQVVPLLGESLAIIKRQPKVSAKIFPWADGTFSTLFPRACNTLGIEDLTFHDLRHEGISRLFEKGYRIEEVRLLSGHRSVQMLFRYVQVKPENLHRD